MPGSAESQAVTEGVVATVVETWADSVVVRLEEAVINATNATDLVILLENVRRSKIGESDFVDRFGAYCHMVVMGVGGCGDPA